MRYHQCFDGQWYQPRKRNFYMKCCKCGLVHRVNFGIRNRRVQLLARVVVKSMQRCGQQHLWRRLQPRDGRVAHTIVVGPEFGAPPLRKK
jgi:hypothetical protein